MKFEASQHGTSYETKFNFIVLSSLLPDFIYMLQAVRHFVRDEVATARNADLLTDSYNELQIESNSVIT